MFKSILLGTTSHRAITTVLADNERRAKPVPGAVVYPDGRPVLSCDVNILAPYRLKAEGDVYVLTVV